MVAGPLALSTVILAVLAVSCAVTYTSASPFTDTTLAFARLLFAPVVPVAVTRIVPGPSFPSTVSLASLLAPDVVCTSTDAVPFSLLICADASDVVVPGDSTRRLAGPFAEVTVNLASFDVCTAAILPSARPACDSTTNEAGLSPAAALTQSSALFESNPPIVTVPVLSNLMWSTGAAVPSREVAKISWPGISPVPTVPSTIPRILAADTYPSPGVLPSIP